MSPLLSSSLDKYIGSWLSSSYEDPVVFLTFITYSSSHCVTSFCLSLAFLKSDNDSYVKFEFEKDFVKNITDKKIIILGGGHLNLEFGYDEFKELLKFI